MNFHTVANDNNVIAGFRTKAQAEAYAARIAKDRGIAGLDVSETPVPYKRRKNEWANI